MFLKNFALLLAAFFIFTGANSQPPNPGLGSALSFIHSLSAAQRAHCMFPFSEIHRYEWHYVPASMSPRNGIAVKDLDSIQKRNFFLLLKAFVSQQGYEKINNIMDLEYVLQQLEPGNNSRIPLNYSVAFYGSPHKDSTWGWKFGGHHIALNFTVVGDQLAFAPFFFGANPAIVKDGPAKGRRVIRDEEDLGFKLINALDSPQQKMAIFRLEAFTEIVSTNAKQVQPLDTVGIAAGAFTHAQKDLLNQLIVVYLSAMQPAVAKTRMKRIVAEDMNAIRFGWAGALVPGKPHYYRVQGKTFLIEFDNTQSAANHIHTVWRDFNGDFGEDLLKEHYQSSHHHH